MTHLVHFHPYMYLPHIWFPDHVFFLHAPLTGLPIELILLFSWHWCISLLVLLPLYFFTVQEHWQHIQNPSRSHHINIPSCFNAKKWKCEPWFVVFVISAKGVELSPASEGSIFTVKLTAENELVNHELYTMHIFSNVIIVCNGATYLSSNYKQIQVSNVQAFSKVLLLCYCSANHSLSSVVVQKNCCFFPVVLQVVLGVAVNWRLPWCMKITKTNMAPGRWGLNEMDVFQLIA
jgi:hypothetical protein